MLWALLFGANACAAAIKSVPPQRPASAVAPGWKVVQPLAWRPEPAQPVQPLAAASGLVRGRERWWTVGDDQLHIAELFDGAAVAEGHRLLPGSLPADPDERKKAKKDFEALVDLGGRRLLAFPSGSRKNRRVGAEARLDRSGGFAEARAVDLRGLFKALDLPQANVEGAVAAGRRVILLQRGNGSKRFNAVVSVDKKAFLEGLDGRWRRKRLDARVERVDLGAWDGVPLSFTDAAWHRGKLYFSAAAERTDDVYVDGEIVGSVIGLLEDGKPRLLSRLPGLKVEGIAFKGGALHAVTDADDPEKPSLLLRRR